MIAVNSFIFYRFNVLSWYSERMHLIYEVVKFRIIDKCFEVKNNLYGKVVEIKIVS